MRRLSARILRLRETRSQRGSRTESPIWPRSRLSSTRSHRRSRRLGLIRPRCEWTWRTSLAGDAARLRGIHVSRLLNLRRDLCRAWLGRGCGRSPCSVAHGSHEIIPDAVDRLCDGLLWLVDLPQWAAAVPGDPGHVKCASFLETMHALLAEVALARAGLALAGSLFLLWGRTTFEGTLATLLEAPVAVDGAPAAFVSTRARSACAFFTARRHLPKGWVGDFLRLLGPRGWVSADDAYHFWWNGRASLCSAYRRFHVPRPLEQDLTARS